MARLATIGPRAIHQPFTKSIYDQLQADTDWDYVPGAALAALTAGNTLNVTSRHHKVTLVGGTIDNIADAAGASEGQLLELYCTAATTIRNNGAGTGNIRTISGADISVAANDVIELVFDGTNWRECARANVNLPSAGKVAWGSAADAQIGRLAAGVIGDTGTAISTGPTAGVAGGGGVNGVFLTNTGTIVSVVAGTGSGALQVSVNGDSSNRLNVLGDGSIKWGPGSGGQDSTLKRLAAGVIGDTATAFSTGPTSSVAGGSGVSGAFISSTGGFFSVRSVSAVSIATSLGTDTAYRFTIDSNGVVSWGPGGSTSPDTTLQRSAANTLTTSNTFVQTKSLEGAVTTSQAGGTTWTPTHTQGLVQRLNVTSAGTITIASPGTPTAGFSGILSLIIHNASGGAITLSWNAAFNTSSVTAPANGQGTVTLWVWNPATSKWTLINPAQAE